MSSVFFCVLVRPPGDAVVCTAVNPLYACTRACDGRAQAGRGSRYVMPACGREGALTIATLATWMNGHVDGRSVAGWQRGRGDTRRVERLQALCFLLLHTTEAQTKGEQADAGEAPLVHWRPRTFRAIACCNCDLRRHPLLSGRLFRGRLQDRRRASLGQRHHGRHGRVRPASSVQLSGVTVWSSGS